MDENCLLLLEIPMVLKGAYIDLDVNEYQLRGGWLEKDRCFHYKGSNAEK